MKLGFYPKLAWEGIRKNKRLYAPYILTGCVMVMMYYILSFLTESPALEHMKGGSVLMTMLPLGYAVIVVFSLLFLFYTNSFLIKQRCREFGLYNILGMDKRNIGRIMLWESVFVGLVSIAAGMALGIALSKAAELVLLKLLGLEAVFELSLGLRSLWQTPVIYCGIYLLLLVNSVIRVGLSKPLELLQSSRVGERIPKRNRLFAIVGLLLLAAAYYLAFSIDEPITAMVWFFVAVIMVILGTYLLFIAGSVVFCRLLQSNKRYYYQARHYVSVSSMVYRMKRNGAGLASICILLTMVLVMISSSACLYFGVEDSVQFRSPNNINISVWVDSLDDMEEADIEQLREAIRPYSGTDAALKGVRSCEFTGYINEAGMTLEFPNANAESGLAGWAGHLIAISLDDYNYMTGSSESLAEDECFVCCERLNIKWDTFTVENGDTLRVKEQLKKFRISGNTEAMVTPIVFIVVPDLDTWAAPLADVMVCEWRIGFDTDTPEAEMAALSGLIEQLQRTLADMSDDGSYSYGVSSREMDRESFYDMYGSLFFLGIMLSIVFILAAVLIIYYKQICEGYEDQARFEIMQKVGMTKREIRSSINFQMLTVFYLPLVLAGVHLAFAFPLITKIFRMFAFDNDLLAAAVNLGCFVAFGILYALVYKITSGTYYAIVSGGKRG